MARLALLFLLLALAAGSFELGGLAGELTWVARICFLVFLTCFIVVAGAITEFGRPPPAK